MNCGSAPPGRVLEGERVEVLRGPQGTRYGQGSAGGVFIFRTRDPNIEDFEFSGEASFVQTRGATGLNYEIAGAVSVPLVKDKLAVRLSVGHSGNPGWADVYKGPFVGTPALPVAHVLLTEDLFTLCIFPPDHHLT